MVIKRWLKSKIIQSLADKRITILYGARQVGKTTLVKELISEYKGVYFSCDEPDIRQAFSNKTSSEMKAFIKDANFIVLDEAQRVENIGLSLKLLHDTYPEIKIIATGSSSFELANKIVEPLTGRNIPFMLYPVSYQEYVDSLGELETRRLLEERIRFGMYPGIIFSVNPENDLRIIANDYLFRDILRINTIRKPIIIEKLVRLLALQSGNEISYNEVAQKLEVSRQTVMQYVQLLEQSFIIFRLPALARNKRDEVTRFEKIFFFDTGIRNALIDNFSQLENRLDKGSLFENFFISERLKQYQRLSNQIRPHFWRTKDGSEIDLVEESYNELRAFECKWNGVSSVKTRAWNNTYPDVQVIPITSKNIVNVLTS
ncbi:ATP-binding protein [Candidatus Azambacteria bacterium]|nr:ATP-binding protein [Candidatus Azambacteria bacterium]